LGKAASALLLVVVINIAQTNSEYRHEESVYASLQQFGY